MGTVKHTIHTSYMVLILVACGSASKAGISLVALMGGDLVALAATRIITTACMFLRSLQVKDNFEVVLATLIQYVADSAFVLELHYLVQAFTSFGLVAGIIDISSPFPTSIITRR